MTLTAVAYSEDEIGDEADDSEPDGFERYSHSISLVCAASADEAGSKRRRSVEWTGLREVSPALQGEKAVVGSDQGSGNSIISRVRSEEHTSELQSP